MTRASQIGVTVMWLLFVAIYLSLHFYHLREADRSIEPLTVPHDYRTDPAASRMLDEQRPLANFVRDFNRYLQQYNASSRVANERTACGYLVAALTALFSAGLVWWEDIPRGWRIVQDALSQWVAQRLSGHE